MEVKKKIFDLLNLRLYGGFKLMSEDGQKEFIITLKLIFLVWAFILVVFSVKNAFGQTFECTVTRIIDGDTIEVFCPTRDSKSTERVRLIGVQTPERGEKNYTKASLEAQRLAGNYVTIERFGTDRYGRTLGIVKSQKGCLNVEMRKLYPSTRYDGLLTRKQRDALKEKGWK